MEQPNNDYINGLANGDEGFFTKVIDTIKKEFPLEKKKYLANFKLENFDACAQNIHKIKHVIMMFGLSDGFKIAESFEDEIKAEKTDKNQDFLLILEKIENHLNQF